MTGELMQRITPYSLNTLARTAHDIAIEKGWWTPERAKSPLECLMLVVTEVAEAAEAIREGKWAPEHSLHRKGSDLNPHEIQFQSGKPRALVRRTAGDGTPSMEWRELTPILAEQLGYDMKPEGLPSELADIIIRVLDLAASLDIDMDAAVIEKMEYNLTRPVLHGGKSA